VSDTFWIRIFFGLADHPITQDQIDQGSKLERMKMKQPIHFLQKHLGEYLESLLLVLFGVGLGVKVLVINHNIDPTNLNLDLMVADYVLIIFVPLAIVALNILINRMLPEDPAADDLDEILETVTIVEADLQ